MKSILVITLVTMTSFTAMAQDEIKGFWLAGEGNTIVEVYEKDSRYFGKIVWLQQPVNRKGNAHTDRMNPDKSLRDRPLMGLDMLQNLSYGSGTWEGTIYSPKKGRTVDVELSLSDTNVLKVKGTYRGFSNVKTWTRTEAPE